MAGWQPRARTVGPDAPSPAQREGREGVPPDSKHPLPNPPPLRGRGSIRGSLPRSVARTPGLHSRLDLARMRRISPLSRPPRGCLWLILNPARGHFPRARRVSHRGTRIPTAHPGHACPATRNGTQPTHGTIRHRRPHCPSGPDAGPFQRRGLRLPPRRDPRPGHRLRRVRRHRPRPPPHRRIRHRRCRPEVRGPRRAEGIRPARRQARGEARRRDRALCRALRGQGRRDRPVAREGAPRGGLDQPREGVRDPAARQRHDLRPGEGRLHRRSRRRRGVPARQPGRYPPGARRRPADGHAAAVPDPQDGPRPRQHRGVPPRRAGGDPRRAAHRTDPGPEGRPDPRRRGQEHHRLRRLRRSRRRRRPAARHRHRLAAHQPPVRGAADRPAGQGAGHPVQLRDPAHLPRHEAARGRSVGRRRRQVPGRREVHRPRHQHHRLRRLRGTGAGRRGPGARLGNVLDQEERPSRQDRRHQPGGGRDGAGRRRLQAPHLARPEAGAAQSVGAVRRRTSDRHARSRARSATSPSSACSSACRRISTA